MSQTGGASSGSDLSVTLCGIELKNPVIAASGTFGYGMEFEDIVHLDKLGGLVVKGLSREPMTGNPPPRLFETPAGMLNAIGLQNIGARAFLDEKLPALRQKKNCVVFANIFGYTREDYERTIQILNEGEGIAAYELNVSCPNTQHGGIQFGSDPRSLDEVVTTAKRFSTRPLIVKLSPNVTSIAQMAKVAEEAGADALSLVNTFLAMSIDPETRKPRIANVTAGFRDQPLSRSPCVWFTMPPTLRESPSLAWVGFHPLQTSLNSCSRGRPLCRLVPPAIGIRALQKKSWMSCSAIARNTASPVLAI